MKRIISFILLCMTSCLVKGQASQLPQVLLPSPEATSLAATALGTTGLFSGKIQASIPLYSLTTGNLNIPIALSYSSSGFKPSEPPTKEGLGWNLGSCTGVLNRTVRGKPDDAPDIIRKTECPSPNPPSPPSIADQQIFFEDVTGPLQHYDSEADEFSVSAPGLSPFRFIFDDDGNIIQFPYSNNKITVTRNPTGTLPRYYQSFTITTPDGMVYFFGGDLQHTEKQTSNNIRPNGGGSYVPAGTATSFYLAKLTLPDGQYVDFTYNAFFDCGYSVPTESVSKGAVSPSPAYTCPESGNSIMGPPFVCDGSTYYKGVSYARYTNLGLATITSSNGQQVTFNYNSTAPDQFGFSTTYLESVNINAGDYQRTYNLSYVFPAIQAPGNGFAADEAASVKRFFLKEISCSLPNSGNNVQIKYTLDYTQTDNLPSHLSFSQDFLGYYNGRANSTLLVHEPGDNNWGAYATADRSFDGTMASQGLLQKITHPTGGYEKYIYEPNTVANWEIVTSITSVGTGGTGFTDIGIPAARTYESEIFHIYKNQTATLLVSSTSGSSQSPGMLLGTLVPLSPGATEYELAVTGGSNSVPVAVVPGDYRITIRVKQGFGGDVLFTYDRSPADGPAMDWVNHEAGGVRVKSIETYDPASQTTQKKYFTYAEKASLNKSSGVSTLQIAYAEPGRVRKEILCTQNGSSFYDWLDCPLHVLTSNTMINFDQDHLGYEYVIESDDPGFKNGGLQHKFDISTNSTTSTIYNAPIRTIPFRISDFMYGTELFTEYLTKSFSVLRKTEYNYIPGPSYNKTYWARVVRKQYPTSSLHLQIDLDAYDVTAYQYASFWNQLNSVVQTDYSNGQVLSTTTSYTYNNTPALSPLNTQAVQSTATDSKNQTKITELKYPTDFPAVPVYQTMIAKNMLSPVIQSIEKVNNVQTNFTQTGYKDWYFNGSIIKPEIVSVKKQSYAEEIRIRYYSFDSKGNPLEVSKENDVHISYLWDYNKQYPIAEVKNAKSDIAYTSFEADGNGNWGGINFSNIITSTSAVTGKKYYSSDGFVFSAVGLLSPYYFVTYWSSGAANTVNGTLSGWPKSLSTVTLNGKTWTLYEHKVVANEPITVTGSGDIDELRMFPVEAEILTYTYSPFVGVSSQCDNNNRVTYYEYDGFARLVRLYDKDRKIIRKICYNYAGQPENCCEITTPDWQNQGSPYCQLNTSNQNTGYQLQLQKDMNTCSPGFNQTRVVELGQNTTACPLPPPPSCSPANCTGTYDKCINNICETAQLRYVDTYRIRENGIWQWYCTYVYCWSDGTYVTGGTDATSGPCTINVCQ